MDAVEAEEAAAREVGAVVDTADLEAVGGDAGEDGVDVDEGRAGLVGHRADHLVERGDAGVDRRHLVAVEHGEVRERTAAAAERRRDAVAARQLGGGSNLWAGRLAPLEAIDFEARDWIPDSEWLAIWNGCAGWDRPNVTE